MIERGGQAYWDTILERKGPGPMPLSGVPPLYNGVIAGLDGGQLARVVLEFLASSAGSSVFFVLCVGLVRRMEGVCGRWGLWFRGVLSST